MCGILINKHFSKENNDLISHRGIEFNTFEYKDVFFTHHRLPIQTLENDSWIQPILTDGGFFLFNGEIFNYDKKRYKNDVDMLKDFFNTYYNYDTLITFGLNNINTWDGFWSIVYVDGVSGDVIIIIDPLSKKQLYYNTDTMDICSEINPLIQSSKIDKIFKSTVAHFGYNTDDRTPYDNIKRFMPNSIYRFNISVYDNNKFQLHEGFNIYKNYYHFDKPISIYDNDLKSLIHQSVKNRLISAKYKISLLVSGGLDSTIILNHLLELGADVKLYSIENNESYYTDLIEDFFNVQVNYLKYDLQDEDLITLYKRWNETPIDLGSVVPQHKLLSAVPTKIVLTGDGADELFGGYKRINEYDSQYSDIFNELPFYHLPRLDRASMRFTKELRNPFLSHDVIRAALQLSYNDRKNKNILKEIYKSDLPKEIIERKKLPLKNNEIIKNKFKYRQKIIKLFYGGK